MSYVVNWRGPDGQAGWHPVGDLTEASGHVEHLRNVEGVTETKIFRLDEVAFEFRQYFRVELATDETSAASPTFTVPAPIEAPMPEPVTAVRWAEAVAEIGEIAEVVEVVEVPVPVEPATPVGEVASFETAEPLLAQVGADGASNGQRRGLFGR